VIRYCPHCWREVPLEPGPCPHCGQPTDDSDASYVERLIGSLNHPEPTRAGLAIQILADMLHEARAVDPLIHLLDTVHDASVLTQAVRALGTLGDPRAAPSLARILFDTEAPLSARVEAATALGRLGGSTAREALQRAATAEYASIADAARTALEAERPADGAPPPCCGATP